jgi:hypothetical protein
VPRIAMLRRGARSLATSAAIVAATMTAALVTASISAPIASAATDPLVARYGLTWHKLALRNGWTSANSARGTGAPAWTVKNGIVYLSGSLRQPSGSANEFAALPAVAWPARELAIALDTSDGVLGRLDVLPDGELSAFSATPSDAQTFTSLAGISFPSRAIFRNNLNLLNGWKAGNVSRPTYSLVHGVVYLSGTMHQSSSTNELFARLPASVRPAHVLYITTYTGIYNSGNLQIDPDGAMYSSGADARHFSTLSSISYPLASLRGHKITLKNGWTSSQGTYDTGNPSYTVSRGVVYLSGSVHQPVAGSDLIGILPTDARPFHKLFFSIYTFDGTVGELQITQSGQLWLSSGAGNAEEYASLASISYPQNS